jgi:hypothetical protein
MATVVKKGGSNMVYIIGGALLLAVGIGAYFMYKKRKKEAGLNDKPSDVKTPTKDISSDTKNTTSSVPTSESATTEKVDAPTTSPTQTIVNTGVSDSFTLNSTERIKAFQDWMDANRPLWILDNSKYKNLRKGTLKEPNRHIGGKGYGSYGANTKRAWNTFGKDYIKTLSSFEGNNMFSSFESSLNLDI